MAVAGGVSSYRLSITMKSLPVGTTYAVWTGIGATGTVLLDILSVKEPGDPIRLLSITLIIVVGLRSSSPA